MSEVRIGKIFKKGAWAVSGGFLACDLLFQHIIIFSFAGGTAFHLRDVGSEIDLLGI
jgi:hypothetical protein